MIPVSQINKTKNLYESGLSMKRVGENLGLSIKQIRIRLNKAGIKCRTPGFYQQKYYFNERFFKIINTEEKAYWLGFIAADGLITSSGRFRLIIRLGRKDKHHLQRFLIDILATNPVKDRINNFGKPFSYISLCSKKLFNDLLDKGIMPKKTFKLEPPFKVPSQLVHHWIRGYFDGDGTVFTPTKSPQGLRVGIDGRATVLNFIKNHCDIERPIEPKHNIFIYRLGKKEHIIKFAAYLYRDATLYLERKHIRFNNWLNSSTTIKLNGDLNGQQAQT